MISPQPRHMGLDLIAGEISRYMQINAELQTEVDRLNSRVKELELENQDLRAQTQVYSASGTNN